MYGDDEIFKHGSPTDKPGPQEPKGDIIYVICNNYMSKYMHTGKKEDQM